MKDNDMATKVFGLCLWWILVMVLCTQYGCGDNTPGVVDGGIDCCKAADVQSCLDAVYRPQLSDPHECGFFTCGNDNYKVCPLTLVDGGIDQ